jgi:hypothetical protein
MLRDTMTRITKSAAVQDIGLVVSWFLTFENYGMFGWKGMPAHNSDIDMQKL